MSITFKFIGYQANSEHDFTHECRYGTVSKKYIFLLFMRKGMNIKQLEKIKFISSGQCISDLNKQYPVEKLSSIFLFTNDSEIQKELVKNIFVTIKDFPKKAGPDIPAFNPKSQMKIQLTNIPLEDTEEEIIQPTEDEINEINQKIISTIQDPDFLTLLRICTKKPELLSMVSGYMSSGNIVEEISEDFYTHPEELKEDKYQEVLTFIVETLKQINLTTGISDEHLKSIIAYFDGHINLILRYIIHQTVSAV